MRGERGVVRGAWCVLIVGAVVFALGTVLRAPGTTSAFFDLYLYEAIYLAAAMLCWRTRARRRTDRWAWRLVALSIVSNVIGDVWFTVVLAPSGEVPYPSLSDAFYLSSYLPLSAAVVLVTRARVARLRASMWLDGLVAGLGVGGLAVALARRSLDVSAQDNAVTMAVNVAYPLVDVALAAGVLAALAIVGLRRDASLLALGGGLGLYVAADLLYLAGSLGDGYVVGGPSDLVWLTAVALFALGARWRSTPLVGDPPVAQTDDEARISWRVLALPALAHTVSVALLVAGWGERIPLAAGILAGACVVATMGRATVTFHEIRDLPLVRLQARTDELTGLANRRALLERGDALLVPAPGRRVEVAALLLLDLDSFKEVNDSLGHHAGDALLRSVARRLSEVVTPDHLLARLGGDEFAVLVPGATPEKGLELAGAMTTALTEPFLVEGVRLHVGASIGVATAPDPAGTLPELLRCADVAMYEAKRARVPFVAFSGVQGSATSERLRTTEELREAFTRGELVIHLQPQVSLHGSGSARQIVGVEALVRWEHPSRGLLAPAAFLEHLEHAGLQRQLAGRVLDLSLAAAARWWGSGHAVPVSVNLSAADVIDVDLPSTVLAALERHHLPATALTVELTEDALMQDLERGSAVLQALRDAGVGVSIDDYGTGYASLAYLRSLPADELKLDRAFTADVLTDPRARAIVSHTAALAHDLGMHLVAEGIETPDVLEALAALGCDRGQGYHVARPVPLDGLLRWLNAATVTPHAADPDVVTPAAAPAS